MAWNDANQRRKFEARMKKQAEEYRAAGMTEEQIQAMYEFDFEQYKSDRRFYTHTQPLNECNFDDGSCDESDNGLLEGFECVLSVIDEYSIDHGRYGWIEDVENPDLYEKLKMLSESDIELLTLYVFENKTMVEIASNFNCTKVNIFKKIERIKNFLL